jgi:hypothetical protein
MAYEFRSDVIALKEIDTGGNSAGNGGDGYNKGDISSKPNINFEPSNKAEGADVHVKNGDHVSQKAYWDAEANAGDASASGDASAKVKKADLEDPIFLDKPNGGKAKSNGDQEKKADAEDVSAKANGGKAKSNGDQESESGHNTSEVDANTTAKQWNELNADQSQMVAAGNGGDGGDENIARGGDVEFALVHSVETTDVTNLEDVLNHSERFDIDDFVHI